MSNQTGRFSLTGTDELVISGPDGIELHLTPWLESAGVDGDRYPAEFFDRLLAAQEDILGRGIIEATDGAPDYGTVAAAIPRVVDVTFVGDPGGQATGPAEVDD
ncbi:MAG: hypothetical protein GX131_01020 [candidate division WS1 bacterium]|jgi:hypothetical protein|nr:hypothetical protein [candidate division WS1 bacterium]